MTPSGAFLDWLRTVPWGTAAALALLENVAILAIAVAAGEWAVRRFRHRPVSEPPLPLTRLEVVAAAGGIVLNSAVTLAGLYLWRRGIIRLRGDVGLRALLDVPILLLVMDALMYGLHRLAHLPVLFELLHRFHHRYDRPRPLTLQQPCWWIRRPPPRGVDSTRWCRPQAGRPSTTTDRGCSVAPSCLPW